MLLLMKQRLSDGEGTARSSSLQPLWKAIKKDMASFFELQRTDIKKHKEAKTEKYKNKQKTKKNKRKDKTRATIVMCWLRVTKI